MIDTVVYDFEGMLNRLTGLAGWSEVTGPASGCGLDYWFEAATDDGTNTIYQAYINVDQTTVSISAFPVENGELVEDEARGWRLELDLDNKNDSGYGEFITGSLIEEGPSLD